MRLINIFIPLLFIFNFSIGIPVENNVEIEQRDYAVLTEFFKVIKDSGLAVTILKVLATNSITEPILAYSGAAFIKTQDLTDLLTSIDKSSLTVDIILRALQDAKFFPGLYDIIDGLKNGGSTTPSSSSVDTVALATDFAQVANIYNELSGQGLSDVFNQLSSNLGIGNDGGIVSYLSPVLSLVGLADSSNSGSNSQIAYSPSSTAAASDSSGTATAASKSSGTTTSATSASSPTATSTGSSSSSSSSSGSLWNTLYNAVRGWLSKREIVEKRELSKRDNEILDNFVDSLAKSGLAMQILVAVSEDYSMHPFARDLIIQIVKQKAITLDGLSSALDATNLLNNGVINTLKSPNLGITIN